MNFIKKTILISFITFFLFGLIDFFFGGKILNFYLSNNYIVNHPIYHHDLDKNLKQSTTYNNVYKHTICTDRYAFRISCNDKSKISKNIDFAFIGDSFTEGVGLNFEETFVGKFKNEKNYNQIINLGVSSYSPKIYYKKIEYLLNQGFKFKRVVIFLDVGDIFDENIYYLKKNDTVGKKNSLKSINIIYQNFNNFYKFKKILKTNFPITFIFYNKVNKLKINLNKKNDNLNQKNREIFKNNFLINSRWTFANKFSENDQVWINKGKEEAVFFMDKIYELSKDNNFKFSLAVYPWPSQILHDQDTARGTFGKYWENYCKNKCEYFINYLEYFHQLKKDMKKDQIVKLYYLRDDVHFNEKGNNLIFQKLIDIKKF